MRKVSLYHADSASEEYGLTTSEEEESESEVSSLSIKSDSKEEEEASGSKEDRKVEAAKRKRRASSLDENSMFPRNAVCENCTEEFDTTYNRRGDCGWHSGEKEFDPDSYIWNDDDHKWERERECRDDPMYADGYTWTCCDKEGNAEGCMKTKYRAPGHPRKRVAD